MENSVRDPRAIVAHRVSAARRSLSIAAGALLGMGGWIAWHACLDALPVAARFAGTLAIFVLGPGAALASFLRAATLIERWAIALAGGLVASAALAHLLGAIDLEAIYPTVVSGLGGASLAAAIAGRPRVPSSMARRDVAACLVAAALGLSGGLVAYAHRLDVRPDGITFYGDYDTYDSSYYAAISAELAHQIPPESLFRAGHGLGYAYHPQLLLAMVHRFGDVPLFDIYFRYAWPAFLAIAALTIFVVVHRLTSAAAAVFAVCLIVFGSDFSWIAARLRPYYADWDRIIWSTNWLTPGAELLYFNTWTPALAILLLGFWSMDRHQDDARVRWLVAASLCFAALLMFKPFAFAPALAGVAAAAVWPRDDAARRRYLTVIAATMVLALPYLLLIRSNYEESQAILRPGIGYVSVLPEKVVTQVGLDRPIVRLVNSLGAGATATSFLSVAAANVLFFVGGFGARLLGLSGVCRSLRRGDDRAVWQVIAWTVIAGVVIPLVIVTEPYHQTFHTAHTSLFLLWIFAAREIFRWTRGSSWTRVLLVAVVLAVAVPSTVHFLRLKWTGQRFGAINHDSLTIAQELRKLDFDRTVFLQRYPQGPSFVSILAERRTVLAWSHYARGSEPLAEEIDAFYRSAKGDPAAAWRTLQQRRVTHVVETIGLDRVHPDVVCRLRLLRATSTLNLYEVPATDPGQCGGGTGPAGTGSVGTGSLGTVSP